MAGIGPAPSDFADRYTSYMGQAEANYQDVLDALHAAEIPATMTQTGGMCLAITFPWSMGSYFLLTDQDDVLSFERDEEQGWRLGLYTEDGDSHPAGVDLEHDRKSPITAVKLAHQGITIAAVRRSSP